MSVVRITPYVVLSVALGAFAWLLRESWVVKDEAYECSGCGAELLPEAALCRACGRGHG